MKVSRDEFYDRNRIAIVPMAFCFPGYDAKGSDLPPPKICADTWRGRVMRALPEIPLVLLVGGYAQRWHLGGAAGVTETVSEWRRVQFNFVGDCGFRMLCCANGVPANDRGDRRAARRARQMQEM